MSEPSTLQDAAQDAGDATAWRARLGVALMGASVLFWLPLPLVPWFPGSETTRAGVGAGLLVSAEVAFWLGAVLAGPEAARRIRGSWRRFFKGRGPKPPSAPQPSTAEASADERS